MVSEGAAMSKGGQATSLVANIKKGRQETRNTAHYGERDEDDRRRDDSRDSKAHGAVRAGERDWCLLVLV